MQTNVSPVLFLCSGNYYRSRFAEHLFNHLAAKASLPYRADSAGLVPNCQTRNHGPISAEAVSALQARGVSLPDVHRLPRDVSEDAIRAAAIVVGLNETEHRPLVLERFPGLCDRIEYWHVDDVEYAPPSKALPLIESNVRALIARLQRRHCA